MDIKETPDIASYRDVEGKLIHETENMLTIIPRQNNYIHTRFPGGEQRIYNFYKDYDTPEAVKVKKDKIFSISYQTHSAQTFERIGGMGIFFGAFTTLIIAPLASIQYKEGGFNKNRYFAIAGGGLAVTTISIPITILGSQKHYNINPEYEKGKNTWDFVKQ